MPTLAGSAGSRDIMLMSRWLGTAQLGTHSHTKHFILVNLRQIAAMFQRCSLSLSPSLKSSCSPAVSLYL